MIRLLVLFSCVLGFCFVVFAVAPLGRVAGAGRDPSVAQLYSLSEGSETDVRVGLDAQVREINQAIASVTTDQRAYAVLRNCIGRLTYVSLAEKRWLEATKSRLVSEKKIKASDELYFDSNTYSLGVAPVRT